MKKTVLFLAGLLLSGAAAQAQWALQPIGFRYDATPAYIDAVDANVAWAADFDYPSSIGDRQVARTINGGATWTVTTIPTLLDGQSVTGLVGLSATVALICVHNDQGGGSILRTIDGGTTWTVQTTATQFGGQFSFPDMIAFFSPTEGVCVGDKLPGDNSFEIYATANAGTTWTRIPDATLPVPLADEFPAYNGVLNNQITPSVVGNSVWCLTSEGRVLKSANKGLTWTISDAGLGLSGQSVAFRDANNGLAIGLDDTGGANHQLARSTDGGTTWQMLPYTGPLHPMALDNVPGTSQFLSVGADLSSLGGNNDAGSSYSRDNGQTWVNIENTRSHVALDVASPTVAWSGAFAPATGTGLGAYKLTSTVLGSRQDVALQRGLSVFPNPSADGRFTVKLASLSTDAQLTVFDALGRPVFSRAAKAATPALTLDLGQQAAGIYTLQVKTEGGAAQQKLVIQ
ncbi:Por secretion system C-terminal sorting domain-containing protein [Hymenobacter daecheongensis DSM 21074]|uniref:Por secretion system C-terminal sorting domain-containing protein n=1 Tax=Hymenobacter daecheongensis DSM 21074 TaxID=1121955 RepID=A0A1M6DGA5_9BACT|nr:T9SS type A sorting domain-containing protein [Hymenobacter daecheongensis]SHI72306.1 Por secretion system C-terminal sorting domain-containing protein [Hymenobacter daecheongensis DSM 21074]